MSEHARLVVLISGSGTNLQAIIDACRDGKLNAVIAAVFSNKPDAYGLVRAGNAGIPAVFFPFEKFDTRSYYDSGLARSVSEYSPDLVILAGWMRILSSAFLKHFPTQVINLHPALPGEYPGAHAIDDAWSDYKAGRIDHTGVMVHYVPDEGVDNGPVILQESVLIEQHDTRETLEERIHQVEHRLLVEAIRKVLQSKE